MIYILCKICYNKKHTAKAVLIMVLQKGPKMKELITLREVQETIMVQNPGKRSFIVRTRDSGYNKIQVFTSSILPEKIPFEYIGLAKLEDGSIHPAYMSKVLDANLLLRGFTGFCNGPEILHSICRELFMQEGILVARSAIKSDFVLRYTNEGYKSVTINIELEDNEEDNEEDFWVASNIYLSGLDEYNMQYVDVKRKIIAFKLLSIHTEAYRANVFTRAKAIRAVIILKSKVNIEQKMKYKWIKP